MFQQEIVRKENVDCKDNIYALIDITRLAENELESQENKCHIHVKCKFELVFALFHS